MDNNDNAETQRKAAAFVQLVTLAVNSHIHVAITEGNPDKTGQDKAEWLTELVTAAVLSGALTIAEKFVRVEGLNPKTEFDAVILAGEQLGYGNIKLGTVGPKGIV